MKQGGRENKMEKRWEDGDESKQGREENIVDSLDEKMEMNGEHEKRWQSGKRCGISWWKEGCEWRWWIEMRNEKMRKFKWWENAYEWRIWE